MWYRHSIYTGYPIGRLCQAICVEEISFEKLFEYCPYFATQFPPPKQKNDVIYVKAKSDVLNHHEHVFMKITLCPTHFNFVIILDR